MKPSKYEKTLATIKTTLDMPADQAIDTLIDCIKKGHPLAAAKAVHTLANINKPPHSSLITLYDWLEKEPRKRDNSCDARTAIVEVLGNIGLPVAFGTFRKAARTIQFVKVGLGMEDMGVQLRASAALAMAKSDPDSLYELSLLLFDGDSDESAVVRKAAAQAISVLGDPGGLPLLAVKLKYPRGEEQEVLAECLESLIFMRPPYLMEVVMPYLKSDDSYLSAISALSLAENLGEEVLDLLLEALDYVPGEAKEAIVIAISSTRCNKARQILLDLLDHPNSFVRKGAVKGMESYPI